MRIRVEEANLQELHQEALLADADELADLILGTVRQFRPVDPLADQHPPGGQLVVHLRDVHAAHLLLVKNQVPEPLLVGSLVEKVELGVETNRPLVEQRDVVRSLLRREAFD